MEKSKEALLAEERKLKKLRRLVDLVSALLWQSNFTLGEAQELVTHAREIVLELFPDKGETFDLIYATRFRRILAEKYHLQ
ncbi:MAG: hypothetical protein ACE5HC_00085 [Candidatus Binatia bacterium]